MQPSQPVGRFQYRKAFALKVEAQQLADIVFVFNNNIRCMESSFALEK